MDCWIWVSRCHFFVVAVQWFTNRSVCLSIWASLAAATPQRLYLWMRVGVGFCEVFRARTRNVASIPFSLSLFVRYFVCNVCLKGGSWEFSMNTPLLLVLQGILGGSLSFTAGSDANQKVILRQISNDSYGDLLPIGLGVSRWVSFNFQLLSEKCGGDTLTFDFATCAYKSWRAKQPKGS